MSVEWNDSLFLSHGVMDDDHRTMAVLINKLYLSVNEGFGNEATCQVARSLLEFSREHFSHEKRLMEHYSYPDTMRHLWQHRELLDELSSLINSLEGASAGIKAGAIEFIDNWFTAHLRDSDAKLADFLNSLDPEPDPRPTA
jgi:hemerythrin-like metal-binding protein